MRIGYLILAHERPASLARLVNRLRDSSSLFFVHVDAKVDDRPFKDAAPAARFVSDRVRINWCGFSMVEATLQLMQDAHQEDIDRFVLLSGADYPLRSGAEIKARFDNDREFIQVDRKLDPNGTSHFDACANRIFLGDLPWFNPRTGPAFLAKTAARLVGRIQRRRFLQAIYYGSSWWALTRAAVEDILAVRRERPALLRGFRRTRSPDEMVFQTILKSSSRSASIAFDSVDGGFQSKPDQACLHYVDWSRPNPNAPRVLDEDDFYRIQQSDAMFIRKIDERSGALLDMIDTLIASRTVPGH